MKHTDLFEAMGEIDSRYIEDAASHPQRSLMRFARPAAIAAAVAVIGSTAYLVYGIVREAVPQQPVQTGWQESAAAPPETSILKDVQTTVRTTAAPTGWTGTTYTETTDPYKVVEPIGDAEFLPDVYVDPDSITSEGCTVILDNCSDLSWCYGTDFKLYYANSREMYPFQENLAFTAQALALPAHSSKEFPIRFASYFDEIPTGDMRLEKELFLFFNNTDRRYTLTVEIPIHIP